MALGVHPKIVPSETAASRGIHGCALAAGMAGEQHPVPAHTCADPDPDRGAAHTQTAPPPADACHGKPHTGGAGDVA